MFTILCEGDWQADDVHVTRVASTRLIDPNVEQEIELAWQRAAEPGVQLFDGPMCRLETFESDGNALSLSVSETSYKPFVGTNLAGPEFRARHDRRVLADPIGCSIAVTTVDRQLLFGRRSARVAYYPNRVHPFAGSLEPKDLDHVFGVIDRELREELNLASAELHDERCLGIVQDDSIAQPELVFAVRTTLSLQEVEAKLDPAEHDAIYAVASNKSSIDQSLRDPLLTPVALSVLTLWRRANKI